MVKQGCQCSAYKIIYWVGRNLKPHGNASSHCTALRRTNVLDEYNKDLLSFGQDSELFTSATTLFGPSFPEKAVEHLKQLHTLRQAWKAPKTVSNQNFPKAPSWYTQQGSKPTTTYKGVRLEETAITAHKARKHHPKEK